MADDSMVTVPVDALRRLVQVAAYVSAGRGYVGVEPYPDATARFALGALPAELVDRFVSTNPIAPKES